MTASNFRADIARLLRELDGAASPEGIAQQGEEGHAKPEGGDAASRRHTDEAEIIDAIRQVAPGRTALSPALAHSVAASLRAEPEEELMRQRLATLTDREREVLSLTAEGESNAGIGKRLFISEGTVKNHMTHILRKLEVADRTQAAVVAVKHGVTR